MGRGRICAQYGTVTQIQMATATGGESMGRLIDAEAWKLDLLLLHGTNEKAAWIINRINHAPTVDAVPVIRCKGCKHHEDAEPGMVYCPNIVGGWVEEEGYCYLAERKEE